MSFSLEKNIQRHPLPTQVATRPKWLPVLMLPTADSLDVMIGLRDRGRDREREREIWSERASEQEVWQCNRSSWCRNRQGLFVATKTSLMQPWQWTALRCSNPNLTSPLRLSLLSNTLSHETIQFSIQFQQTHKRGSPHAQLIRLPPCISLRGSLLSHRSSPSCNWSHFLSVTDACSVNFNPLHSETPRRVVSPGTPALTKKTQQNKLNIIQSAAKRGREWTLLVKTCV